IFMGILRRQEKRLAIRLLSWQYKRVNLSLPAIEELERQADRLVDDAHRIARESGRNVMSIIKEMIADVKK
ncbi:MAG: hypothetical protein ABUJ92_04400, partial [Desulfobacterales bacterium]